MQLLTGEGGIIIVSSSIEQLTEDYTLTFTHLDDSVSIDKTNVSIYPERYLEFNIDVEDIDLITEGTGTIEIFHASSVEALRKDSYSLILTEEE